MFVLYLIRRWTWRDSSLWNSSTRFWILSLLGASICERDDATLNHRWKNWSINVIRKKAPLGSSEWHSSLDAAQWNPAKMKNNKEFKCVASSSIIVSRVLSSLSSRMIIYVIRWRFDVDGSPRLCVCVGFNKPRVEFMLIWRHRQNGSQRLSPTEI